MHIIHRICHFILYALIYFSKLISSKWEQFVLNTFDSAYHFVYRTDLRMI